MRTLPTDEALRLLSKRTYCLWIGAGVATHLGLASGRVVPSWSDLVDLLEREASITAPERVDFPSRLEVCRHTVGRTRFQRLLREKIVYPLADALKGAKETLGREVPAQVRQIAQLGCLANPCVNFNIEVFTSYALLDAWGAWKPLAFAPRLPGATDGFVRSIEKPKEGVAQRLIYHPHGALDLTGLCVMTSGEYRSLHGTLALQLAAHSAFGQDLAIVGMSLDDEYLRSQIELFREQIRTVIWFQASEPSSDLVRWAYRNRVNVCVSPWQEFWRKVQEIMPAPNERAILRTWWGMLNSADHAQSNPTTCALNSILEIWGDSPESKLEWMQAALMSGEHLVVSPKAVEPLSKFRQELGREQLEFESQWIREDEL